MHFRFVSVAMLALVLSCGPGGGGPTGTVQIFVVPEDSIANGLEPGTDLENIQDGWTITYTRYLVTVGNFRATRTDMGATIGDPTIYVLDLKNAPSDGYVVKELKDVASVRWDKFGFDIANAKSGAQTLSPTKQADVDFMIQNGYSVYYEGFGERARTPSLSSGGSLPALRSTTVRQKTAWLASQSRQEAPSRSSRRCMAIISISTT